mmetsp:Transcript_25623/g.81342  ORF Transcript_25623/g.81342 Transcript_25623/m.81342 type:complete len:451 (+) Transcript_25623:54-1406(+)
MPFTPYPVYNLLMSDQHAAQDLLELSIPEAGDLDVLGGLGAHVGVGGLDGLEHASDLTGLGIVAGHVEDGGALELDDLLVVLTRELLSISGSGEGHSVVVAGGGATALGVEEGGATVRGDGEVTAELGGVALADELLDGEEEGDALAARELHGGGGVVDAILLSELHGAVAADVELAGHAVEGVGEAGHELGLDELRVATLELGVLLDGEGGGLHAEEVEVVAAGLDLDVGGAGLNHGAGVGNAGALHLEVGEALQLVVGERLGALQAERIPSVPGHRNTRTPAALDCPTAPRHPAPAARPRLRARTPATREAAAKAAAALPADSWTLETIFCMLQVVGAAFTATELRRGNQFSRNIACRGWGRAASLMPAQDPAAGASLIIIADSRTNSSAHRARVALAEVALRDTLWAEPVAKVEVIMMAGGEVGGGWTGSAWGRGSDGSTRIEVPLS